MQYVYPYCSGFNEDTGQFQIEIKGLVEPKSKEASRICQEDLNEVIAAFVQDNVRGNPVTVCQVWLDDNMTFEATRNEPGNERAYALIHEFIHLAGVVRSRTGKGDTTRSAPGPTEA